VPTREAPLVAWTGTELLVAGGVSPADDVHPGGVGLSDAAAFDPETGAWRAYPTSPVAVFGTDVAAEPVSAVLGDRVVAPAGDGRLAVLDTATEAWVLSAPPPASARYRGTLVAAGHEMLMLAARDSDQTGEIALSYRPS
jgi:hypothetical protein